MNKKATYRSTLQFFKLKFIRDLMMLQAPSREDSRKIYRTHKLLRIEWDK